MHVDLQMLDDELVKDQNATVRSNKTGTFAWLEWKYKQCHGLLSNTFVKARTLETPALETLTEKYTYIL